MRKRKIAVFMAAALLLASVNLTAFAAEKPQSAADVTGIENRKEVEEKAQKDEIAKKKSRVSTDEVTDVEILSEPGRTVYYGDTDWYDTGGMTIRLTYEDGSTVDLQPDEDGDWYDEDNNYYDVRTQYTGEYDEDSYCYAFGEQTVEVYCGEASAEFSITVLGITRLSLKSVPDDVVYYGYDSFVVPRGLQLNATFTDGSEGILEYGDFGWTVSGQHTGFSYYSRGIDTSEKTMTILVEGLEVQFPVTVKEVKSITLNKAPDTTTLYGEVTWFSLTGMELNVALADGTSEIIYCDEEAAWRKKSDDTYINGALRVFYEGKHQNDDETDCFEYGTWPVKVTFGEVTTSFNITIIPYTVVDCGNITVGNGNQVTLQEKNVYKYTFTPQETALYDYSGEWGNNEVTIRMKQDGAEVPRGSGWILKAGLTYTLEIIPEVIDKTNNQFYFVLNKEKTIILEKTITTTASVNAAFNAEEEMQLYTFVPAVSGIYMFYSDAPEGIDPYADLYDGEMKWYIEGSDDNNQIEGGNEYNFGLRAYLTAGQTYRYAVRMYGSGSGAFTIALRQEEDTCVHQWKEQYRKESTCSTSGYRWDWCEKCGISSYVSLPKKAHTFGAYTVTREATVFQAGIKTRTCSVCKQTESQETAKLTPVLKLNAASIPLKVKQSTTAVKVTEMAKGDAVASWKSSNTKIVKVTNSGKITAGKKTGKATLTVTLKSGKSAKVTVKVQKKKVTTKKVKVNAKKVTLKKGQSYTIAAELNPITSQDKVTYSTSKKSVATVSKKGVVKAKKAGTAKITVKSGKKKATITVKVTK